MLNKPSSKFGCIIAHATLSLTHLRLENIEGDWHEFESKALRRERDKERRAEYQRDKEKRKGAPSAPPSERDPKRVKQDGSGSGPPSAPHPGQ